VRAKKLGVRFRRQQVIQGFIVDFYCHKAALVVEVDGDIHDLQKEEDARREKVLSELGLRIVRFRNDEVVRDVSAVVGKIRELTAWG
jgi:very-short-patch-repair endonuclease